MGDTKQRAQRVRDTLALKMEVVWQVQAGQEVAVTAKHAWHLEAEAGALAAFGHGWAGQYSQPSAGMPACSGKDKIHKPNVVKTNINSSMGIWLSMARRCVGKTLSATRCARYTLAI